VPTGMLDEKYTVHPIYSIYFSFNVTIESFCGANNYLQTLLKPAKPGYPMADLFLQNFQDIFKMPQCGIFSLNHQGESRIVQIRKRKSLSPHLIITNPQEEF
jgi:hypothetical protein